MSSRAARRRQVKVAHPASSAAPAGGRPWWWRPTALCLALLGIVVTARFAWLERRITWYLAVDQFGYVTFAEDLLAGRLFHSWPPATALAPMLPKRADVLVQSYIFDHGRIYSRYAPGFPILLAGWITLAGRDHLHLLNPLLFCAGLVLLASMRRRLGGSWWQGVAVAALVALCPTQIHFWALTPTRDVATHVVAFAGLFLLVPRTGWPLAHRSTLLGALILGFAASMRPDATMYLIPAGLLLLWRWRRERAEPPAPPSPLRALGMAGLGYALGITPLVAYDLATTGNPLPAQSIELNRVLGQLRDVVIPPAFAQGWHGTTDAPVSGGALQLSNLPRVLPAQLAMIQRGYGPVLTGAALWGALVALVVHPTLFLAAVPYSIAAVLFFSCWVRPDPRYLIGVHLWMPMLIVEGLVGTRVLARWLRRRGLLPLARALPAGVGAALLAGAAAAPHGGALSYATWTAAAATGIAGIAAAAGRERRIGARLAPALAIGLAALAAWTDWTTLGRYASFQRPQMLQARAALQRVVEPGGVVITTEDVGRPMENIQYYGRRDALYMTDLRRWRMTVPNAAGLLLLGGLRPYLLLPHGSPEARLALRALTAEGFAAELVADIPPAQAMTYFVAARFHRGIRMALHRLRHERIEQVAEAARAAGVPPAR